MSEPHRISASRFAGLWWLIRGVTTFDDYRCLCLRCGRTGQAHWGVRGCWRYKGLMI